MPSIFDCANHFDDIQATDGYTAAPLFKVQTSTFLGASPDGSVSQKRIFSMAPNLTMPARGCIVALGERYVTGASILDGIYGAAIRRSYWAKMVTDSFELLTPGQACLGTSGTAAYGRRDYLKDVVNSQTDSEYDPFWEIFFTTSETVVKGGFMKVGTTFYRARSVHLDEAGFQNAASDELDAGSRVSVTFAQTGAYNPITDSYAAGSVVTDGFLLDRYKAYDLLSEADELNKQGDMTLIVAASAITPTVGRNVTIGSQSYRILNSTAEQDAWSLHVRRV